MQSHVHLAIAMTFCRAGRVIDVAITIGDDRFRLDPRTTYVQFAGGANFTWKMHILKYF
jgi:hypothetical protein